MQQQREERPWGYFEVLAEGPGYKVKRLVVNPGQRTSLQYHQHRDEVWFCVAGHGRAAVNVDGGQLVAEAPIRTDDHFFYERREVHRLHNTGNEPLVIIEVQRGEYLGEDDIVRLADVYGRA